MADSLINALKNIHLEYVANDRADNWVDNILEEQHPRKRIKQDQEQLKRTLEERYLIPSTSFSPEWLNKLQQ
jgi:antiviral helicase SKI2